MVSLPSLSYKKMEKKESEELTTEGPSFFQLVKAPLTTDFLRIPPCFVKKHLEEDEESVVLKGDSSGAGTWHVKLERNEDGLFLRQGWKDFHRDNSLEENEFLLFRYDGAMVFSVRIFKVNGLERDVHVQQPLIPPQTASSSSSSFHFRAAVPRILDIKSPDHLEQRSTLNHPTKKSKAPTQRVNKFEKG